MFDHGPKEFPLAIVRPHAPAARAAALVGDLQRWIAVRWEWLRPRTVPVAFAALGMVIAVLSTDFLAHDHGHHLRPHVEMIRVAR